jgi:acyl carrier protein
MPSPETIAQRVRELVSTQLRIAPETVTHDATLQSLGADSLDIVELVMRFEDEFHIEIKDEDAETLHTFNDMVTYIAQQQGTQHTKT